MWTCPALSRKFEEAQHKYPLTFHYLISIQLSYIGLMSIFYQDRTVIIMVSYTSVKPHAFKSQSSCQINITMSLSPTTSRNISIGFQSLLALNIKFCLLFLTPKWGWHLNISVTSSDFRPLPHLFVLYVPWRGGSFLSLGLGQPWPCLDLLPLLPLLFGIAFHLQLVLLSCHPIFLRPYHFLKLVSFLGANRTKSSASV